jgi:DNA-directed RNA polymerase subunit RPC12/RpoP
MWKRYLLYLLRWQLSTPILAPIISYFKNSPAIFGTKDDWLGAIVANFIGGLIFFWVDRFIFNSDKLGPVWNIVDDVRCVDCGKIARGYRLIKTKKYDKIDALPEFRCEACSIKKENELRKQGKI